MIGLSLLLGIGAVLAACPTCTTQSIDYQPPLSLLTYRCLSVPGCLGDGAQTECSFYDPPQYTQVICTRDAGYYPADFEQCYQHSIKLCQTGG